MKKRVAFFWRNGNVTVEDIELKGDFLEKEFKIFVSGGRIQISNDQPIPSAIADHEIVTFTSLMMQFPQWGLGFDSPLAQIYVEGTR